MARYPIRHQDFKTLQPQEDVYVDKLCYIEKIVQNSFSEALGACLLAFLFFMLLLCGCSFHLKLPITYLTSPLSLILSFSLVYLFFARGKTFLLVSLTAVLLIIGSALVCCFIYDSAYDSYGYHNNVVVMIVKGWNPVYTDSWDGSLWSQHYAKGLEMMQAVVLALSGNLQSTKCVNFIFVLSAASLAWSTIDKVFSDVSVHWKTIITIMLVSNPIVISQLTTSYNDYALWLETVILACALLQIWKTYKIVSPYLLLCMVLVIGINTKFTHFYYLGIECLFFAIWCICAKRYSIISYGVITIIPAILIGIFLVGYNPYILNILDYGNPFYPLVGGEVDIMTDNTPAMFENGNRFINFIKSLFSIGDTEWGYFKWNFSSYDFLHTYSTDARVNGFGVVMAPVLILGIILMFITKANFKWWIVYLFCLVVTFSFEQAWWARYVPFLWTLTIIPVLTYATDKKKSNKPCKKSGGIIAYSIFSLVIINALLGCVVTCMARYSYTIYIDYIIDTQKAVGKPFKIANINFSFCQIFDERNVEYLKCENEELTSDTDQLFYIYELSGAPIIAELPMEDYPQLYATPTNIFEKLVNFPKRKYDSKK